MMKIFISIILCFYLLSCSKDDSDSKEIKESPVERITIIKAEVIEGTIILIWEPLLKNNFDKAVLKIESEGVTKEIELSKEIIASSTFNDQISVQKNLNYSIVLSNTISHKESNIVRLVLDDVNVAEEIVSDTQIKVVIGTHPVYKNFDYYKYNINGYFKTEMDSEGGEYFIDYNYIFANNNDLQSFELFSHVLSGQLDKFEKTLSFDNNFKQTSWAEIVFSKFYEAYYGLEILGENVSGGSKDVYLNKLNPNDLSVQNSKLIATVVDNFFFSLTIDPTTNNLILDLEEKSIIINPSNFSIIEEFNANDYYPSLYYNRINTKYRDGIILVEEVASKGSVYIYNLETKENIYSELKGEFIISISDNGKYFYNNKSIYHIDSDNKMINLIASTDYLPNAIAFLLDQNKIIYSHTFYNPVVYNLLLNSSQVLNEYTQVNQLQYDEASEKILMSEFHYKINGIDSGSRVNILNLDGGSNKKIEVLHTHFDSFFRLLNNKLIFSGGIYLDVDK